MRQICQRAIHLLVGSPCDVGELVRLTAAVNFSGQAKVRYLGGEMVIQQNIGTKRFTLTTNEKFVSQDRTQIKATIV